MVFSIIGLSCVAQKKISSLGDNSVIKAKALQYSVKKEQNFVAIENSANKFTNVKQRSPNMSVTTNLYGSDIKVDYGQITKICAAAIPLQDLEKLPLRSSILITIKSDIQGNPLEVSFFTDGNSALTLSQLEEIETSIKKSLKISIRPEVNRLIQGSNFLAIDINVAIPDILKAKKAK